MFGCQFPEPIQFSHRKAEIASKSDRVNPEFCRPVMPIDVDKRWLIGFVAVKLDMIQVGLIDDA